MEMNVKIGSAQAAAIAARGAQTVRTLSEKCASLEGENAGLRTKIAQYEREGEVRAIAEDMEQRGLNAHLTMDEKVANISRLPDLTPVREAIKMASAGGELRIARVVDQPGRGGLDPLTALCVGAD